MEYDVEIKNNIIYFIPLYLGTGQNVMIPISKIDILGPVTFKYSPNTDKSKVGKGHFYYAFSLSAGREILEIKTALIDEDSLALELDEELEKIKEMRQKIVSAMETQYSGYMLNKPKNFK